MIVLIDTDVLLDLALDREPHAEAAARLVDALERRPGTAFVAWHTVSNFYYLVAPSRGREGAREFVRELTRFVQVAPTKTASLHHALELEMGDFEDAMQVAAALACKADVIATRNLDDYKRSPVRASSPKGVLDKLDRT